MEEKVPKKIVQAVKDTTNLDILKPVMARLKKRVKEIQELSQAKNTKIMRGRVAQWHTEPPKMFIAALQADYSNGVGTITYQKYKMEDGKKVLAVQKTELPSGKQYELSGSYVIEEVVVETIEFRKPMKTERFKENVE